MKEYDGESDAYTDIDTGNIRAPVKPCWVCEGVDERFVISLLWAEFNQHLLTHGSAACPMPSCEEIVTRRSFVLRSGARRSTANPGSASTFSTSISGLRVPFARSRFTQTQYWSTTEKSTGDNLFGPPTC